MMEIETNDETGFFQEQTIRLFYRHFVSLGWIDKTPGERAAANGGKGEYHCASGFILSVQDRWFLVTAGHVLEDIEKAQRNGQILGDWVLDDTGGQGAVFDAPIPFPDYEVTYKWYYNDEDAGDDYGMVYIRPYYRALLEKNGIIAFDEQAWKLDVPSEFDKYLLLGLPLELIEPGRTPNEISKIQPLITLEPIDTPPAEMEKESPRLYAKLPDRCRLKSIEGMSGGPILGLKVGADRRLRYWVVAIQSAWRPGLKIIAACPVKLLADGIDEAFSLMEAEGKEADPNIEEVD